MADDIVGALAGEDEVQVEFTASSGKKRKIPVWFVVESRKLELLPMYGLKTKWFQDVEKTGTMVLSVKRVAKSASPTVVKEKSAVEGIKKRFAAKYGEDDVRKYYPTSQVALVVSL